MKGKNNHIYHEYEIFVYFFLKYLKKKVENNPSKHKLFLYLMDSRDNTAIWIVLFLTWIIVMRRGVRLQGSVSLSPINRLDFGCRRILFLRLYFLRFFFLWPNADNVSGGPNLSYFLNNLNRVGGSNHRNFVVFRVGRHRHNACKF